MTRFSQVAPPVVHTVQILEQQYAYWFDVLQARIGWLVAHNSINNMRGYWLATVTISTPHVELI